MQIIMKISNALCTLCACLLLQSSIAQAWTLEVQADHFEGDEIYLAYYLGPSQYIMDSAQRAEDKFVFTKSEPLVPGVYLIVFPPDNKYFQLFVGKQETDIRIAVDIHHIHVPYRVSGSEESSLFYAYLDFIAVRKKEADGLRKERDTISDQLRISAITSRLHALDSAVTAYQEHILSTAPATFTALMIRGSKEVKVPEFDGTEEEVRHQTYRYVKDHYFDNLPMQDERLIRTPSLHQRIDYYVNKLTAQVPDSINASIDYILSQFDPHGEAFKVYLVYFLNHYAKSNIVGMDGVYVHLVDKYYANGLATWTEEEQLNKIIRNAQTLSPLLIGKTAPDLRMQDRDQKPVRLHDVDAVYTVLFFWDPDCGHCKKSMPKLVEFYEQYRPRGVEIFAVCTRLQDDVPKCWESIDQHHMGQWINVCDPYLRTRFKQIYDIRTTPQIYVLDKDKKIVMKKISAEQLPEVIDHLIQNGS